MGTLVVRIAILALVSAAVWVAIAAGRRFVESRRQRALAAAPALPSSPGEDAQVRILAFSSEDCTQCHRMQAPALRRVLDARPGIVVHEIDAPSAPELTHRYSVLTVPTTVVLDAEGRARAVNYGFANAQRLLAQVDEALATAANGAAERIESAS